MILTLISVNGGCAKSQLKNFEEYNLKDWPVDGTTLDYEKNYNAKLRSIDDCVREIKREDLNDKGILAIEKRMMDISVFLIHQGLPSFIIQGKIENNLLKEIKACNLNYILWKDTKGNENIKSIFNVFNQKTLEYIDSAEYCDNNLFKYFQK